MVWVIDAGVGIGRSSAGEQEDACKGSSTTIQKSDELMECGLAKITIQHCGTNDGREIEQHKLRGDDDLCVEEMQD